MPSANCAMALGWSPAGPNGDTTSKGLGIVEHDVGDRLAPQCPVLVEDLRPESFSHGREDRLTGALQVVDDRIGVDDHRTVGGEARRHGGLPRPDPSGQPDEQHGNTVGPTRTRTGVLA
jgi:hypothetical protein